MRRRATAPLILALLAVLLVLTWTDETRAEDPRLPGLPDEVAVELYKKGEALVAAGKPDEAVRAFEAAAKRSPLFHLAHYAAGNVLAQTGKHREAMKHYDDAVAIEPGFASGWNAIGVLHLSARRLEKALAAFRKAVAADGDLLLARLHLGRTLNAMERYEEAEGELRTLLRRSPEDADGKVELAVTRVGRDDRKGAARLVEEVLAASPDHGPALLLRARLLGAEGKLLEAANACHRVLEKAGKDPAMRMQAGKYAARLADAARTAGDHATHVRALEIVILVVPKEATVHARLGAALLLLYESKEEADRDVRIRERAIERLERSLELDPEQPEVRKLLDRYL